MGSASALSLADAKRIGGRQVPGVMRRRVLGEEHPDAGCLQTPRATEYAEAETIPLHWQATFKFNGGAPERAPQRAHPP
jgi:hypothetical protein